MHAQKIEENENLFHRKGERNRGQGIKSEEQLEEKLNQKNKQLKWWQRLPFMKPKMKVTNIKIENSGSNNTTNINL